MKVYETEKVRNIVLVGNKGVGKSSIIDNLLFASGGNTRIGSVTDNSSLLDTDPLEQKRHQSILCKVMPVLWKDHKINVFDTPGYADFIGEAISAMYVADVAVVVVDSVAGVEIPTKRLHSFAKKFGKPVAYIVNKMDAEHADFDKAVHSIKENISHRAVPIHMPIGKGTALKGSIDLLAMKAFACMDGKCKEVDIPADMKDAAMKARTDMIESIAESNEALMEKYLSGAELTEAELKSGVVAGILSGEFQPIMLSSAVRSVGMDPILNSVITWFPSPSMVTIPKAFKPGTKEEVQIKCDSKGHHAAYVFKVTSDPGIGDLFFFRIYSGTVTAGIDLENVCSRTLERFGHIFIIRGKERDEVASLSAGDIGVVAKLKSTSRDDTLCDKSHPLEFEEIGYPEPMVSLSVKPASKQDQDKLGMGLSKFMALDPTFKMHLDKEFNETIISGIGETQLEVVMEKLKEKFGINIEVDKPRVPYRETIKKTVQVSYKHKKQSGGKGQFGECYIELSHLPAGQGFVFEDAIAGGSIPGKYVPAVEKGVRDAMHKGVLAGYPVVDVKVKLFDGSYHDVDSSDMAFQIAGSMAFKKAEQEASPILLEPIMHVEITVPKDNVGDVSSDVSGRRGKVSGMDHQADIGIVKAQVPLAELYKYSTTLRSMTAGAGSYSMSFSHYEQVPAHIVQKVIDETNKFKEEKAAEK